MKIKVKPTTYEELCALKPFIHKNPLKQSFLFRGLQKFLARGELKDVNFTACWNEGTKYPKEQPCLILMNHSSFIDLSIVSELFSKRPYHIVCTRDAFVGKSMLMRLLGCVPTVKFATDATLVRDMKYCLHHLKESVVLFPEAGYCLDGTQTVIPSSVGKCVKMMNVPVLMVKTKGAFLRDPLYNNLQKRNIEVSATVSCLATQEETQTLSVDELNRRLTEAFTYDHFKDQVERGVRVVEDFRADGLHRMLYKCPDCGSEGHMEGAGISVICHDCGLTCELTPSGKLQSLRGNNPFEFVSDWFAWERQCVREEIEKGTYDITADVDILVLMNSKSLYDIGSGTLTHNKEGLTLVGCDGRLNFTQSSKSSYTLNADFFWYERGDIVSIGNTKCQYYCFPKDGENMIVAKARLAVEEAFKLQAENREANL